MTIKPQENASNNLDERLADFADRALADHPDHDKAAPEALLDASGEDDLLELERTILRLKSAFPPAQAQPGFQSRLRLRMVSMWCAQNTPQPQPAWKRWLPSRPAPRLSLALALACLLLAAAALLLPAEDASLVGAAGGGAAPVLGLVALAMVALTIWLLRDKK